MKLSILPVVLLCGLLACREAGKNTVVFDTQDLNRLNRRLLDVAMEDGFSPPIASRVYVYPHIAHYVTLRNFYPDSLAGLDSVLNDFPPMDVPKTADANAELSALFAFCKTARRVVFSEFYFTDQVDSLKKSAARRGLGDEVIRASETYADSISERLARWMAKDNYVETRTMDRFTSSTQPGEWRETPPDYQAGLEAHWGKIRPLVIDSAGCVNIKPPPAYNDQEQSEFYRMVTRVYEESKNLDSNKIAVAWFWDDNPNTSTHKGHLVSIIHKISPPGHWLNIISQVSNREKSSLFKTTRAYTFSAIAMFDAIISCWHEKYRCNLVRPVTYIQEFIDVEWTPLIQTPPFPEYTSGHSALSAAAATVLTDIFGDRHAFSDSSGLLFGQPVRTFNSFHDAAWEVSLSRFYAGIHYYESIEEGNKQGRAIGDIILKRLKK